MRISKDERLLISNECKIKLNSQNSYFTALKMTLLALGLSDESIQNTLTGCKDNNFEKLHNVLNKTKPINGLSSAMASRVKKSKINKIKNFTFNK